MPFYEYACSSCNKSFKTMHGADETITSCELCNAETIKKLIPSVRTIVKDVKQEAGSRVEKFIEESRGVLAEQMSDARKELK